MTRSRWRSAPRRPVVSMPRKASRYRFEFVTGEATIRTQSHERKSRPRTRLRTQQPPQPAERARPAASRGCAGDPARRCESHARGPRTQSVRLGWLRRAVPSGRWSDPHDARIGQSAGGRRRSSAEIRLTDQTTDPMRAPTRASVATRRAARVLESLLAIDVDVRGGVVGKDCGSQGVRPDGGGPVS